MTSPPQRRWFAFSMRELLVLVVALGCVLAPLAIKLKKAKKQQTAVEWVLEKSGSVEYKPGPKWLRNLVGDDYFQSVRSVRLDDTRIRDLSPLRGLSSIRKLSLINTTVSDLTPLQGLTNLQHLDLEITWVTNLSPLEGLSDLQELDFSFTKVTNLSPLHGLTKIRSISMQGTTKVTDEQVRRLQKALPNCKIER